MTSGNNKYRPSESESQRTRILLGLLVALSVFFTAMEWQTGGRSLLDDLIEDMDITVDLDQLPEMERDDMVAAPVDEVQPKPEDDIRKVDEVVEQEAVELKNEVQQTTEEDAKEDTTEVTPPMALDFNNDIIEERVLEELAEFPGGYSELVQFLTRNLHYPTSAMRNKQKGEVIVQFIVDKDGSIKDRQVIQKASPLLNNEALRVVGLMPKWKPATSKGNPVRCMIQLPIVFAL